MAKCVFVVLAVLAVLPSAYAISAGSLDCKKMCTKDQCKKQQCDLAVPFACVAGSAAGGCSSRAAHFENTTACTECCDIRSCAVKCDKCSADQCAKNPCDRAVPFLCTAGADKGGCAANRSIWEFNSGCSACCDSKDCPHSSGAPGTPIPPSPPLDCDHDCGDLCHNADRCPSSTPYMCSAGPSKLGCSNSSSGWDQPSCTACCNVKKCPKVPCGTCSASVCADTQCSLTNPYICTSGALNGGCSPLKNYWPESPSCDSCCDYSTCPSNSGSASDSA